MLFIWPIGSGRDRRCGVANSDGAVAQAGYLAAQAKGRDGKA